jgi:hypothetical protein
MSKKIKLVEAPIDYGDYPERMDPRTERKVSSPENPFAKALRGGTSDVEKLIGSRFKKVVDKLKSATGIEDLSNGYVMNQLIREMNSYVHRIVSLESRHKEELEKLATELALDVADVEEGWYEIEARLNRAGIDVSNFRMKKEEQPKFEMPSSFEVEELTDEEKFELEKAKRNIINAIVQGSAKKGHYIFQLPNVKARLDEIDPSLYTMYSKVMAINDLLYFTMEQMIEQMSETGSGVAGKSQTMSNDDSDDENAPDLKIVAEGLMFPILVHEIIKGIEEAKGKYGLPEDPEMAMKVMGQTDVLSQEPMQLRIGPELVEKIKFALPAEVFEPQNKGLISFFQTELYSLPAKEFLDIISDVVSEDDAENRRGMKKFNDLLKIAKNKKNQYDESKKSSDSDDDDDDEDFKSFLKDLNL